MDIFSNHSIGYIPLFALALVNQIGIPAPVDLIMLGLVKAGLNTWFVIVAAIAGMTVGSTVDFAFGKYGLQIIPWIRKEEKSTHFRRAHKFFQKYGEISLFFTWFPFIGKYLPLVAGIMKISAKSFLTYYILGKILYYGVLVSFLKLASIL